MILKYHNAISCSLCPMKKYNDLIKALISIMDSLVSAQAPKYCSDCRRYHEGEGDADRKLGKSHSHHATNVVALLNQQIVSNNPLKSKDPRLRTPAAAASKSFLYVKHIVKNMKARFESYSESANEVRKWDTNSIESTCSHCKSNINFESQLSDTGDTPSEKNKGNDDKTRDTKSVDKSYSLEPLRPCGNTSCMSCTNCTSAINADVISHNGEKSKRHVPQSIQSEVRHIVDDFTEGVHLRDFESWNDTQGLSPNLSLVSLHPTNPFVLDVEHELHMSKSSNINQPHSIRSEVSQIRKSFEEDSTQVVENVNRKSFDLTRNMRNAPDSNVNFSENKEVAEAKSTNFGNKTTQKGKLNNNTQSKTQNGSVPRSMKSEVSAIRTSFQDDVAQVVKHVDKVPFDWKRSEYNQQLRKSFDEQQHLGHHNTEGNITSKNAIREQISDSESVSIRNNDKKPLNNINHKSHIAVQTPQQFDASSGSNKSVQNYRATKPVTDSKKETKKVSLPSSRRQSYPKDSAAGLLPVSIHNALVPTGVYANDQKAPSPNQPKYKNNLKQQKDQRRDNEDHKEIPVEEKESTYIAWISMPNTDDESCGNISRLQSDSELQQLSHTSFENRPFSSPSAQTVDTKSDIALQMVGRGIKKATLTEEDQLLSQLSVEYDNVFESPSNVEVEAIGRSISVINTAVDKNNGRKKRSSNNDKRVQGFLSRKKLFHTCHKCHKVVETGESVYHLLGGLDTFWHTRCLKCHICEKILSQGEHSFYEDEPYCMEHYVNVARIPKCFKCQELIFDSTYTATAGKNFHMGCFTCFTCLKPLVDTKYVLVQNKDPYCFSCHEKHFPKYCKSCQRRISPHEPYVKSGDSFWHSTQACVRCSTCGSSLVGRSMFFRKDGNLYCNRYCALR